MSMNPPCRRALCLTLLLCWVQLSGLIVPADGLSAEGQAAADSTAKTRIVFEGNEGLGEVALRKAAETELAGFAQHGGREADIDDAAYQMEAAYRKAGFPFAVVDYRIEKGPEGTVAIFEVQEGEQVYLSDLRLEGNTVFEEQDLETLFEDSRNRILAGDEKIYVEAEILDGASRIQDLYRSRGYLDAKVHKPEVLFTDRNSRAVITIRIEENQQSVIQDILYAGDTVESAAGELEKIRQELIGQPFFPRQRFTLEKQILELFGNLGYADATAKIEPVAGDPPTDVTLSAEISSGVKVTIRSVEISGNNRTRERFIRSRLQFKPGDTFSIDKKHESFRQLYRTGLFTSVDIGLEGEPDEKERTLVVTVSEAPAKEVYVEPGWGSYERLRVKFGFRELNLMGTGRILDASTKLSVKAQGVGISLIDPWFFNSDITAELPVSYERREEPSFTREDVSASFLLTKELSDHVTVTGGYTFQRTSLTDVDPSQSISDQDEDYDLGTIRAQIGFDTRNDIFFPTKGQKSFLSAEYAADLLGGNVEFGRLTGGLRYFVQLRQTTVLAMRYSTGLIIPGPNQIGVPIGERFFKGGENTVRSFEEGQLGPKDDSNDPVGGYAYNVISIELRQQLINRLTGSLFLDLGNIAPNRSREELGKPPYGSRSDLWEDTLDDFFSDFRPAVGAGVQYLLPFGPARLDFAFNPDRDTERDEDLFVWHFSIGMAF
jgi:outer membrane protein insertion porin family